jgi:hypothetical protein
VHPNQYSHIANKCKRDLANTLSKEYTTIVILK